QERPPASHAGGFSLCFIPVEMKVSPSGRGRWRPGQRWPSPAGRASHARRTHPAPAPAAPWIPGSGSTLPSRTRTQSSAWVIFLVAVVVVVALLTEAPPVHTLVNGGEELDRGSALRTDGRLHRQPPSRPCDGLASHAWRASCSSAGAPG